MKWLVFTAACVVALVALGVLAVDERNVVWEGRVPHCPYCRVDVAFYAVTCKDCGKNFDWEPRTEPCRWCLERDEARVLRQRYRTLAKPDNPASASTPPYAAFVLSIEEGDCTFCGGLGAVVERGEEGRECPVCFGGKRCIGCKGDRDTVVGHPAAERALQARLQERERARRRESATGIATRLEDLLAADVRALAGYAEAEDLRDAGNRRLLQLGMDRVRRAADAVSKAAREAAERSKPSPSESVSGS
ncbi:MAG: hypothetical protein O7C98_10105 [Planctomycetota bacterium]|nr:hypothetical protein [Planctomycetota bacterium]